MRVYVRYAANSGSLILRKENPRPVNSRRSVGASPGGVEPVPPAIVEAIMTAEQPGKIGLRRELQLLWRILLRWRKYRAGDYMRAVQQESFNLARKEETREPGSEK